MKKYLSAFFVILVIFLYTGCPTDSNTIISYDPDPVDDITLLEDPEEVLYVVVNIDGTIYGFSTDSDPTVTSSYEMLATDSSTEEKYANIRISDDLKYLLYARVNGDQIDLVLRDIEMDDDVFVAPDVASNESEFIDNNTIFYTDDGYLYIYNVGDSSRTLIIPHQVNRCNHWAQISPSLDKMVYKDQDPYQSKLAIHSYTEIDLENIPVGGFTDVNDIISYDGITSEVSVNLYDPFYYSWRNNDSVIFKNKPGNTSILFEKNITTRTEMSYASIEIDSNEALFSKVLVSPDKSTLLLYGHYGVYLIDLEENEKMTGTIEPVELYTSLSYSTEYASFGTQSGSFVLGTDNWIGIYNTAEASKTNISVSDIWELGTLYAVYCR